MDQKQPAPGHIKTNKNLTLPLPFPRTSRITGLLYHLAAIKTRMASRFSRTLHLSGDQNWAYFELQPRYEVRRRVMSEMQKCLVNL